MTARLTVVDRFQIALLYKNRTRSNTSKTIARKFGISHTYVRWLSHVYNHPEKKQYDTLFKMPEGLKTRKHKKLIDIRYLEKD